MRQRGFFRRHGYTILFTLVLLSLTTFVMLDTFVLPTAVAAAQTTAAATATTAVESQDATAESAEANAATDTTAQSADTSAVTAEAATQVTTAETSEATQSAEPVISDSSYSGNGINTVITTVRVSDTTAYVADVQLTSADSLKTALAQNTFGTNITQTTSEMAQQSGAILAINGDYYGANKRGYVIKNGVLYRDTVRQGDETEDLAIYADGTFAIIDESDISAQELLDSGVVQLFAFGPALVENGELAVTANDEVTQAKTSNPRTAIGIIDALHYIIVVSDGRTSESEGLSLLELAKLMQSYGCTTAYNLDGGGSSTMVFNGTVVNQPTTNGKTITEREVSDIVYIAA